MTKMKKTLLIAMLLFTYGAIAQVNVKKSSISTSGGSMTAGNKQVIFTIGEVNVQETDVGNTHLSEGFIGPDVAELIGIQDYGTLQGVQVFPNPVKDNVQIRLPESNTYEIRLFDLNGKELWTKQIEDADQAQYNLSRLQTGVYLLIVIDRKNKLSHIIKLQKA